MQIRVETLIRGSLLKETQRDLAYYIVIAGSRLLSFL